MQAITRDMMILDRDCAPVPVAIDLRLARLGLPPAWRPAVLASLRLAMGAGVGAAFGAACGNAGFWGAIGMGLGAALDAIARRG